jgi:HK97 gp10 family phage protein
MTFRMVVDRVPELTASVVAGAEAAAESVREAVAESARENAPVDTGELEESIGVDGEEVYAGTDHAGFVEFGTVHMPAQPFFAPALAEGDTLLGELVGALIR